MATLNLLTSSYNGKLGEAYGVTQYHKKYVKAVPFSHTPHNSLQTRCVRSFEILNRFSSTVSKYFFSYMNLSSKKMSKHNAVAKLFKPLISTHVINFSKITEVFGNTETFFVSTAEYDEDTQRFYVVIQNLSNELLYSDSVYFIGIFSNNGIFKGGITDHASSGAYRFYLNSPYDEEDFLIVLRSVKKSSRYYLFGAYTTFTKLPLISAQTLWTSRFDNPEDFTLNGTILDCSTVSFSEYNNGVLIVAT